MKKFVHIGFPKSGSTWLQANLFQVHPEIHFLGRGTGGSVIDDEVRLLLCSDLIYKPRVLYDAKACRAVIERHVAEAGNRPTVRLVGVSHESLTTSFLRGQDLVERATRLRDCFGPDTRIVMIIRSQLSQIESMYKSAVVELGLQLGFREFVEHLYLDYDRSPLSDLLYWEMYCVYRERFAEGGVSLFLFERFKRGPLAFANDLCAHLGLSPIDSADEKPANPSPSAERIGVLLRRNRQKPFYLGQGISGREWGHTSLPWYTQVLGVPVPERIDRAWERYKENRKVLRGRARHRVLAWLRERRADLTMPDEIRRRIAEFYASSNMRLAAETGLPLAEHGYPM